MCSRKKREEMSFFLNEKWKEKKSFEKERVYSSKIIFLVKKE
jgi:hypothetical protein